MKVLKISELKGTEKAGETIFSGSKGQLTP